jgi:hypothetical protein
MTRGSVAPPLVHTWDKRPSAPLGPAQDEVAVRGDDRRGEAEFGGKSRNGRPAGALPVHEERRRPLRSWRPHDRRRAKPSPDHLRRGTAT